MIRRIALTITVVLFTALSCSAQEAAKKNSAKGSQKSAPAKKSAAPAGGISAEARRVQAAAIVMDTHDDTTQRLIFDKKFDISKRDPKGHIDIPRMREGGLNAIFFSIWMESSVTGPKAVKDSVRQIDAVHEAVRKNPKDFLFATTAADVRRAKQQNKIAALIGVEGGHMIDDDLGVLRMYAAMGVRYMTLTHFGNNNWADSSTDKPAHNGLTDFGKDVVREMNRLGVMVDISHVADKTFYDALEITKAPVIASHSSCRSISNHARNMNDDMIRALAKNGGVMQINYHVGFLDQAFNDASRAQGKDVTTMMAQLEQACGTDEACKIGESERADREGMMNGRLPKVYWEKIVEHIDHVVKLVGPDHVGLGSDFDGATMPFGMEDVSMIPKITDALLKKGYKEEDVKKVLGGNLLRVMEQVEKVSRELNGGK